MAKFRSHRLRHAVLAAAGSLLVSLPLQAHEPGWYVGIQGYYSSLEDSEGSTFIPGTPGTPGTDPQECLLGDLLGLGSLLSPEGCLLSLIGGGAPGTDPLDPTQDQRFSTAISYKDGYAGALTLGYLFDGGLRPELSLSYGRNDWDEVTLSTNGTSATNASSNRLEALRAMGNLWFDLPLGERLRPYLGGGLGYQRTRISGDLSESDNTFAWQLGAGLGWAFAERWVASLDYRYAVADDPEYETDDGGRLQTEYASHNVGLGLRYTFAPAPKAAAPEPPPPPPEPVVRCPDTPEGIPVGPDNCPLDSDGDGVPDHLDECPNTPPGLKVLPSGCALEGDCRRPRPGEQVDANGCAIERSFILKGVKFEFDSDRLTPEAQRILDEVAETLKAYPGVKVDVEGHTDWIGTDAYNLGLSERRANSVKRYLVDRGVDGPRMNPVGYGESRPIDDNETEAGRENNRRVELKVIE